MKKVFLSFVFLAVLSATAIAAETSITWHGHATFEIKTPKGVVIMIDPWLKNPKNPNAAKGKDPVKTVKRLDYILITHGHRDHIGNAVELGKQTGAKLITNFDLGKQIVKVLGYPKEQATIVTMMNIGGELKFADDEISVAMTPAMHGSGLGNPLKDGPAVFYTGNPTGYVVKIKGGPSIYHSGDTAYFLDMKLIGEIHKPDIALLTVGDRFTMGPAVGAMAAMAINPRFAVPMHYGTFPLLAQDITPFIKGLAKSGIKTLAIKPGQTIRFKGKKLIK